MKIRAVAAVAVVACVSIVCATSAQADSIENGTGLANPGSTITFDEVVLPSLTVLTNQYAGEGVTFSPNLVYDAQLGAYPNIVGHRAGNFFPVANPFTINFTSTQSAAAFSMVTNPAQNQTTFTALLGNVVVESFSATTNLTKTNNYYGFENIVFDSIRVDVSGDGLMLLDNIQFNAVPEPSSLALLGLGVMGLGLYSRRRARA